MTVSERSKMNDDDDDEILLLTVACTLQFFRIRFNFTAEFYIEYC
jgi:hypothetical protein